MYTVHDLLQLTVATGSIGFSLEQFSSMKEIQNLGSHSMFHYLVLFYVKHLSSVQHMLPGHQCVHVHVFPFFYQR